MDANPETTPAPTATLPIREVAHTLCTDEMPEPCQWVDILACGHRFNYAEKVFPASRPCRDCAKVSVA